ncbi:hypothetical protein TrRE_jg685 [Triparma retinervis]|uniref:Uncharacterized protein n=1 Tax=Triparma retinervis TaxID=2557542 RepID=A0A9W7F8N3_9STRA|nr:hypothetical protein TrRE_jg685 [Triparma retinervis]
MEVDEATVVKNLRGSGSVEKLARVQRRLDIKTTQAIDHEAAMRRGKKMHLQYYKNDPAKRTNKMKAGGGGGGWDKVTNEIEFASSVPTVGRVFPQQPTTTYRNLVRIVDTLDNVGTKAASPVHLINTKAGGYDHPINA